MDRAVLATASALYASRHYPSVIAVVTDALAADPENVALLLLRAQARMALCLDRDAHADLRDVIRLDPQCGFAYQLLRVVVERSTSQRPPRFALGTQNERVHDDDDRTPVVTRHAGVFRAYPAGDTEDTTNTGEVTPRTMPSLAERAPAPIPEAVGFGEYLVEIGLLTRERLRAAQAYQRSMKVQLSAAIVALGLASRQRVELAVVAHQSRRRPTR